MHNIEWGQTTSGVETEQPIRSIQDFADMLRSGKGFRPIEAGERAGREEKETYLPVLLYGKDGIWIE